MFAGIHKQMRRFPALVPLFAFVSGGGVMAVIYLARLALKNPDVCWDRKNNPEPWNKLSPNHQYKFYSVTTDYSQLKKERPDF
ncbi:cytochrome c oxidase subunit NDUFA4L [Thalassophryne amazonica]|uniref:cytochrome c oxidase subunit NDUFA4L n=1 Tax=Thalassophryne amazonica TaxID=390379 RepID=UPI001471E928|nr:cytochrome c oxidase subunit NDUFA4L [Thalassophryne amazonica]XP_034046480.1 cytochrome c oxidase subunit NDUFA4L [Thalassophryne amazonica]